ncbi:hypothetical protein [Hymenobacter actinosclerus]|uniref:Uncharacterized protein n=1 Tax=Hymenobacter actinosclerus TaxID=82805 RepID=A0A1I0J0Q0_9BACT|nr:hypothetical protein [Hymenobacter actinosclerus]SEU02602.1 hypothetical protein SAMN04487998_3547 [Hymenobacter actinosclerus]
MLTPPEELRTLGNPALLALPKTVFLCSRAYPAAVERDTYLWAMEQRQQHRCIASGFHSRLEQTVYNFLRQEPGQPIVYALGRGIQHSLAFEHEEDLRLGQLLFITPFEPEVSAVSFETAAIRNLLLADMADDFFIPYVTPGGNLAQLLADTMARDKPLLTLDVPGNAALAHPGARIYQPAGLLGSSRPTL